MSAKNVTLIVRKYGRSAAVGVAPDHPALNVYTAVLGPFTERGAKRVANRQMIFSDTIACVSIDYIRKGN